VQGFESGDKVKFKSGKHQGTRAIVESISNNRISVRLAGDNSLMHTRSNALVNFSLAARKAWKSMPTRRVGRPKGVRLYDRISVTLRIDRAVWSDFQTKEQLGLIQGRTETINRWLKEKLARIKSVAKQIDAKKD
jgi:uncharacterized protein (DUF4415 family)